MLITLAILGWIFFAGATYMYVLTSQQRTKETKALAVYSLALLLSPPFRELWQEKCDTTFSEVKNYQMDASTAIWTAADGLIEGAPEGMPISLTFLLPEIHSRYYES